MTSPQAQHLHQADQQPADAGMVAAIASLLLIGATAAATAAQLSILLKLPVEAVRAALAMTDHDGTSHRGTRINMRVRRTGILGDQRRTEALYRAAYVWQAAKRLSASLADGLTARQAVQAEKPNWRLHERARRARVAAVQAVQDAADQFGPMVGWHNLTPDTPECKLAAGHDFPADTRPKIGWPGTPHGGTCKCTAGPPFDSGMTVDEATRGWWAGS